VAQVGRISGPLLEANLERNGIDLAFRNDLDTVQLLYLDVNSGRIAVNRDVAAADLDVTNTTIRTGNLIGDTAPIANYTFSTNNIDVNTGYIYLNASEAIVLSNLETANFFASDNAISSKNNANIELRPNGSGTLEIFNDLRVDGNLHATGNITLDGTITFGDTLVQDTVTFDADINSDILLVDSDLYKLGKIDKRWNELFTLKVNGEDISTGAANIGGIDLVKRTEYTVYVASNGNDTNAGDHAQGPLATIQEAISRIPTGTSNFYTIHIFPGTYQEQLPLVVPIGVTIAGTDMRNTIIKPAPSNEYRDVFHLNGESTVQNLTVKDFYYDSVNNTGHAFRFAPNAVITSRSPYIQNVSVITQENLGITTPTQITVGPGTTGYSPTSNSVTLSKADYSQSLVDSLVGQTAVIDRYPNPPLIYTVVSIVTDPLSPTEWRMTVDTSFDPTGQFKPISFYPDAGSIEIITNDIWDTTGSSVGEKWVAWFKTNLPVDFETIVQPGWTINVAGTLYIVDYIIQDPVNSNQWRIYVTTSLVAGTGIPIFSSPTVSGSAPAGKGALIDGAEMNPISFDASMLFHSVTMITPGVDAVTMTNGVRVEWLNSFTYFADRGLYAVRGTTGRTSQDGSTVAYGAELRSIGSASVYGNYGAVADGADTLMYLILHNFAFIGSGNDSSNDSTLSIQGNEAVKLNSGKIYYQSHNKGRLRIGEAFFVDLERGTTSVDLSTLTTNSLSGLVINTGTDTTTITGSKLETGNIRFAGSRLDSLIGDLNLVSASTVTNFTDNTTIRNDLRIRDNFTFDGTLNFKGNDLSDRLKFNVELDQNFNPNQTLQFSLGSTEKFWVNAYLTTLELPNLSVVGNVITATNSNSDIELRANGVGNILIPTNNVTLSNKLTVSNSSSFKNIDVNAGIAYIGNITQTGNYTIAGEFTNGNVLIKDNFIVTTNSNSNLELRANGIGNILIPNNNVIIEVLQSK
jgi:hypothetical protein